MELIMVPWHSPIAGWEKINVDAYFSKDKAFNGLGLVIRDHLNAFGATRGSTYRFTSAEEGEALVVLERINWARTVPSHNSQNFIYDFCSSGKGLSTTKDTGSGRGLSTTKAGGPLRHNFFPDPEPEYGGYPETNGRGLDPRRFGPFVDDENDSFKTILTDVPPSNKSSIPQLNVHLSNELVLTNVPQSNEPFQTIPTNVPLSNEPYISQSSIYLSNEPMLNNVPPSNEPMLSNVLLSIKPEPIIRQAKTSAEFRFEP
ncbi:hypothetical protein GIB67_019899 [Kingdonia uniflora]|uniref:Uncharacterized protein n=1 Tax=Kingdonia uniflora TaxID=39325 RepID=A0A7J7MKG2_9MAGN|nr:hypothetical protein GIB67_019899 [Kingdonia uniflora]